MFKRIAAWLATILRNELKVSERFLTKVVATFSATVTQEIDARVKVAVADAVAELKKHAEDTAEKVRAELSHDALTIAEFRQSTRMSCSHCGRYGWKYEVDKEKGTVTCAPCAAKGK